MRRTSAFALVAATLGLAILSGCIPQAVIWSPDGQWGVVVVEKERLVVCDGNGKLSKPFLDGMGESLTPAAWLPDSRRFVAVRERLVDQKDLSKWLVDQGNKKLINRADLLRQEILAYGGDWKSFKPSSLDGLNSSEEVAVLLRLRHELGNPLPKPYSQWKRLTNLAGTTWIRMVQVVEMVDGRPRPGKIVVEMLEEIGSIRVSPDGKNLAYVQLITDDKNSPKRGMQLAMENPSRIALFVISIDDPGSPRLVASGISIYPDWTPDSQSLVYVGMSQQGANLPEAKRDTELGTVYRRRVASKDGVLLEQFGKAQAFATLLYWPWEWVRCLNDGRILISGVEVTLPATEKNTPKDATLFVLDPRQSTITKITKILSRKDHAELPADGIIFGCMTLSPDKKRLAITGKDSKVCILTLASGDVTTVQDSHPGAKTVYRSSWRTNDELCLVVPAGSKMGLKDRDAIVLWSQGKSRCISRQWREQHKTTQNEKPNQ